VQIQEKLLLGARETMQLDLEAQVFADNLSDPIRVPFQLNAIAEAHELSAKDLVGGRLEHLIEARDRVRGIESGRDIPEEDSDEA